MRRIFNLLKDDFTVSRDKSGVNPYDMRTHENRLRLEPLRNPQADDGPADLLLVQQKHDAGREWRSNVAGKAGTW
jgi:hypothetical protein